MESKKFGKELGYDNTFKRIEEKYILTKLEKDKLMNELKDYLIKDKYFNSDICNIYFDDTDNNIIINSMDKPIFKLKVRLRSYMVPSLDDNVFLEIKNKYKKVVGKRRVKMTLREFYDFYERKKYNYNNQILKEIAYYFNYYKLIPSIFISYNRKSYLIKNEKFLRITFDSNLISRRYDLNLEKGIYGEKYFNDDKYYIMEIKTLGSLPLWFVKILSRNKIYPESFSKFGKIYEKEFTQKGGKNA